MSERTQDQDFAWNVQIPKFAFSGPSQQTWRHVSMDIEDTCDIADVISQELRAR